ncbi:MarR family transcriptional regulator [Serinibacter arcticus]|uniref:MarR family transcriptional regulator n=2 Tax=Serinibacter arcticus TaxID=1655435 RepID=A0A2U1ZZA2_9MICO|nr:MarR family transcriptional regulator [Serinibacter arcticus]
MELVTVLPGAIDVQLRRDAGINTFEYQILAVLSSQPRCTQGLSDLAAAVLGSPSRLSHALTRLQRAGWVERRDCTELGGRRAEATLTEGGLAKIRDTAPGHVREVRRLVVDTLTAAELEALGAIARKIVAGPVAADVHVCTEQS